MNFNDLKLVGNVASSKPAPTPPKPTPNKVLTYQEIVDEKPIVYIKFSKEEIERRRTTEPGHKIPSGQFHQVGQWCERCEDVTAHAQMTNKPILRCLICKNDYNFETRVTTNRIIG